MMQYDCGPQYAHSKSNLNFLSHPSLVDSYNGSIYYSCSSALT